MYRSIRLLPKRGKEPYVSLYKLLGFYPYNIELYQQALLHKSSSIRLKNGEWINNERLEFLGDAVLSAIVSDFVFKRYESEKEGFLTTVRSRIVQRETLNKFALNIGLDKLIKTATTNKTHHTYVYGNALEALIGAIYLDEGYKVAQKFIHEKLVMSFLDIDKEVKREKNFKSRLIEWGQKSKVGIVFRELDSVRDSDGNLIFKFQVLVDDKMYGEGTGYTKKEAQQQAAKVAMKKVKAGSLPQDGE